MHPVVARHIMANRRRRVRRVALAMSGLAIFGLCFHLFAVVRAFTDVPPSTNTGVFVFALSLALCGLVANAVILYAAQRVQAGGSSRWGYLAGVLGAIPVVSPTCFVGFPLAIWLGFVLQMSDDEVVAEALETATQSSIELG